MCWTTSTWCCWPTRCSPTSVNASPTSSTTGAAGRSTPRGRTAGCCYAPATGSAPRPLSRLRTVFATDDPTNQVSAAWAIKELLRQLLAGNGPSRYCRAATSHRRTVFLQACADADMPETTRLAATIERWWPEIEGFLQLGVTNARTEGYNRVIKQIKRVACGFRNQTNYERRIMLHTAARRAA